MFSFLLSLEFWKWLAIFNAVVGSLVFMLIWNQTKNHRRDTHLLEKKVISQYRRDVKRWNKYRLFLGAITIAVPRFLGCWITFAGCFIYLKICSLGVKVTDTQYISGTRKYLM